jgi:uncharacterized membrane protein (UPF0136 family)
MTIFLIVVGISFFLFLLYAQFQTEKERAQALAVASKETSAVLTFGGQFDIETKKVLPKLTVLRELSTGTVFVTDDPVQKDRRKPLGGSVASSGDASAQAKASVNALVLFGTLGLAARKKSAIAPVYITFADGTVLLGVAGGGRGSAPALTADAMSFVAKYNMLVKAPA